MARLVGIFASFPSSHGPANFALGHARSIRSSEWHKRVILPGPGALLGVLFLSCHLVAGRSLETYVSLDRRPGWVNVPYGQ